MRVGMADSTEKMTREERLAAKLRENLRRRKAQARGLAQAGVPDPADDCADPSLPKTAAES
jgi:hypothetical protein